MMKVIDLAALNETVLSAQLMPKRRLDGLHVCICSIMPANLTI